MRATCLTLLLFSTALAYAGDPVTGMENYHPINAHLATAGQLLPAHVEAVDEAGFEMVINLAPAREDFNDQEGFLLAGRNISYANIPVSWEAPTQADVDLFFALMDASGERKVLVHCFANYRASAFTYLYRVVRLGVPEAVAREDLMSVWSDDAFEAYPVWRALIDSNLGASAAQD